MSPCKDTYGCITCSDEALPMYVLAVDPDRHLALCSNPRQRSVSVEIALVEPVVTGELLLVHAGTALCRADPREALAGGSG